MKNFHIVRISPLVNITLRHQIDADPANQNLSYEQMSQRIFSQHYNYGDSFRHVMQSLGNRCEELLFDSLLLQKKWVEEHGLNIDFNLHWQLKVIVAQLKELNPDFVYIQSFHRITPQDIMAFKDEYPNLKKIIVHNGFPGKVDGFTSDTLILSGLPLIDEMFKKEGATSHLLYHGFDTRILDSMNSQTQYSVPFSFIGSSGYGHGLGHKVRYWELLKLAEHTPIQLWLDDQDVYSDTQPDNNPFAARPLKERFYQFDDTDWDSYPLPIAPLRYLVAAQKCNPPLYGMAFFQGLYNSLMTYHRHGDISEVGAMRLFQATGVGSCLITDSGSNMKDLFEPDKEVVTYSSLAECVEKVNYLAEHPEEARQIALNGQKRTRQQHTAKARYEQVHHILQDYL